MYDYSLSKKQITAAKIETPCTHLSLIRVIYWLGMMGWHGVSCTGLKTDLKHGHCSKMPRSRFLTIDSIYVAR